MNSFKTIANNETKTHIKFSSEIYGSGLHQAHDKNGTALKWKGDAKTGKFEGTAEFITDKEGNTAYKESTITINDEMLNNENVLQVRGQRTGVESLTSDEAIVGTFVEEADHSTNPETTQAVKDRQEGIQNDYDVEAGADIQQDEYYEELREKRDE